MKTGIIYGSSSGLTEQIAFDIKNELGVSLDIYKNINKATLDDFQACDQLILGTPTYDYGELQEDWKQFFPKLDEIDFSRKLIALFGLGDQVVYPDTFLDAMGTLGDKIIERGGTLVGAWPKDDYEYGQSLAERDGKLIGLGIDINTQGEFTGDRIRRWVSQLKKEMLFREKVC